MPYRLLSDRELRGRLAELNRLPLSGSVAIERAEVCQELAVRNAALVAGR